MSQFRQYQGNPQWQFDPSTGQIAHYNRIKQVDVQIVDMLTDTAPLLNRAKISTNNTTGRAAVGDIITVTAPPGMALSNIQGLIDKGAGFVSVSGFTGATYTLTASEIAPAGQQWPLKVQASLSTVSTDALMLSNPVTVPAAPTIGTATAGNLTVTGPYTAPADTGGSAITSYDALLYVNGVLDRTLKNVPNPAVFTAAQYVQNGVTYQIRIRANNAIGPGPLSAFSNAVTPAFVSVYARSKAAMAAVAAGTGYFRAAILGDSTTAGARSLGPAANALRSESPVVYLRDRFNLVQSLPTIAASWISDQSFGVTNTLSPYAYDTRLSQPDGAGFTYSTTRTVAGSLLFNTTNAFRLGFLPEAAVDTFDVYYAVNTSLGAFDITRAGSTLIPVSQAGTSGTGKVTLSGTLSSSNPIYVARNTGGAYVIGMDAYNSAIKSIRLFGLGWSGGKVSDWIVSTQGFDPLPALLALNLDFVMPRPGINDGVAGTNVATYKTQLATLVDALLAAGTNVALATHYPSNVASASQAVQDAIAQATRDVANERGLAIRDTYAQWGTWVAANALGYMADNLHPNKAGYQAEAVDSATFMLGLFS